MSQIIILSGPPHAGKSAVTQALCDRYDRMAHIDVQKLRDLIRMGRLRPWDETPDGIRQRKLLIEIACDIALRFADAEYGVVIEDVVMPDDLSAYAGLLGASAHFVLLLPALDVVTARERDRPSEWRGSGRLEDLHRRFVSWSGVFAIDPGRSSPVEVADRVMQMVGEGSARLR